MTDPIASSLLRQEGPQQVKDLLYVKLAKLQAWRDDHREHERFRAACDIAVEDLKQIIHLHAASSAPKPDTSLLVRLRDYHDQVLKGFRHMSRVEEADLIQAAIDGLRQDTTSQAQTSASRDELDPIAGRRDKPGETGTSWRPIRTAPKDGTQVVLFGTLRADPGGRPRSCVSWYCRSRKDGPAHALGWFFAAPGYTDCFTPTHWMPVPPAEGEKEPTLSQTCQMTGGFLPTINGYRCTCGGYWNTYVGAAPTHQAAPVHTVTPADGEKK